MKQNSIIKLLFLPAFTVAVVSSSAYAEDSQQITFTGTLTDQTCSAEGSDKQVTVPFGTYPAATFATAGTKSPAKKFEIKLTGCPEGINAPFITFSGTSSKTSADGAAIFENTATGGATNIGAVIYDKDGKGFTNNTKADSGAVISGGNGAIPLTANLISTGTAGLGAENGDINIPVTFSLSYN